MACLLLSLNEENLWLTSPGSSGAWVGCSGESSAELKWVGGAYLEVVKLQLSSHCFPVGLWLLVMPVPAAGQRLMLSC